MVVDPPAAYLPAAAAAALVTTSFWLFASRSHGSIAPRLRKRKNSSPSTRTLGSNRSTSASATRDLPAPGGPETTISPAAARTGSGIFISVIGSVLGIDRPHPLASRRRRPSAGAGHRERWRIDGQAVTPRAPGRPGPNIPHDV